MAKKNEALDDLKSYLKAMKPLADKARKELESERD